MAPWLILTVGAQLVNAVVALIDKYIVSSKDALPRPFVYAYITCLMSGASILVYAFNWIPLPLQGVHFPDIRHVVLPSLAVVAFSFLAAYTFFSGIVSLFSALRVADASDVVPVVGAVSALGSFGLGYAFLGTHLSSNFIAGIVLLSFGTLLVSHLRFKWQTALLTIHAGFFFALHYITFKGLLAITDFDNAFFWSRIGFVTLALTLLLVPEYFEKISSQLKSTGKKGGILVLVNKVLAGIGSILILKSVELGDPAVVQALGGLQFIFLLIIGFVAGPRIPQSCGENCNTPKEIFHKTIFVAVITLGFFVLFV